MSTIEVVFLILLFAGLFALLAGVILTRLHWRPDIPPYGLGTHFLDVTRHPQNYVKDAPLHAIRSLNLGGALMLAGAAGVVVYDILRVMRLE
jgi:hypothetical protein